MKIIVEADSYEINGGVITLYVGEENLRKALAGKLDKIKKWFKD